MDWQLPSQVNGIDWQLPSQVNCMDWQLPSQVNGMWPSEWNGLAIAKPSEQNMAKGMEWTGNCQAK